MNKYVYLKYTAEYWQFTNKYNIPSNDFIFNSRSTHSWISKNQKELKVNLNFPKYEKLTNVL